MNPSVVIELNRAVAVAMADGPGAGMAIMDDLEREGRTGQLLSIPCSTGGFAANVWVGCKRHMMPTQKR